MPLEYKELKKLLETPVEPPPTPRITGDMLPTYCTIPQAAKLTHLCDQTLRDLIHQKQLPAVLIHRSYYIPTRFLRNPTLYSYRGTKKAPWGPLRTDTVDNFDPIAERDSIYQWIAIHGPLHYSNNIVQYLEKSQERRRQLMARRTGTEYTKERDATPEDETPWYLLQAKRNPVRQFEPLNAIFNAPTDTPGSPIPPSGSPTPTSDV